MLDTVEALFCDLSNAAIVRIELRRLFRWLKDKGVTANITGEKGDGTLTRQGIEEHVSDCVTVRTTASRISFPPAACVSSSTAARRTAPTSIPSSTASASSRCCRSYRSGSITKPFTVRVSIDEGDAYLPPICRSLSPTAVQWV